MRNLLSVSSELSPNEHISKKTGDEIEAYLAGRGKTRIHEGARNLSLNISDDYGNRFLVELIQNAHDAHPMDRSDGEISIVLAPDEGPFGCLYVANRGEGFEGKNFESITNIALSSKPVNESIGNKGLGFRSVLQICQWPEIYSVLRKSNQSGTFNGYCFRFVTLNDLDAILERLGKSHLAAEIWENMPSWFLPVVATSRPGLVDRFAQSRFATVVRMPLQSNEAHAAVVEQIRWLINLETPLHLFLNRVARITIELEPDVQHVLERRELDEWSYLRGIEIQRLGIGSDEFLITSMDVPTEAFRTALNESLEKKQIPMSWADWKGTARVNIAIRLNRPVEKGLLYCFLPLGEEGRSPFSGYINANFYTKIDRRNVDLNISLHRLFVLSAATLCRHTIDFLIDKNWPESPGAVVDLLCWRGTNVNDIKCAFGKGDREIVERQILPTWSHNGVVKWKAASETYIWNAPVNSCLSPESISLATGDAVLLPSLLAKQRESLTEFFRLLNEPFKPSSETIANWIEKVAKQLVASKVSAEVWAKLYDEVAEHLRSEPSVLFGKQFLLSASGDLIASSPNSEGSGRRRTPDIYFPPALMRDVGEDQESSDGPALPLEKLPASLKQGFAFLSAEIPWTDTNGYRPGRTFFLEAKLVREYDTREVLRTLATITRSTRADSTKQLALEWSFRLWLTGRAISEKETRSARFALPTRGGWKLAEKTLIGVGWPTANGRLLEKLLRQVGDSSEEFTEARECLLPSYKDWPVQFGTEDDWMRFLLATGSLDCLRPVCREENKIQKDSIGHSIDNVIVHSVDLDDESKAIWARDLALFSALKNPNTNYRAELRTWRFPGQGASLSFTDKALRRDYAFQILKAIPHLQKEHKSFRVFRPLHSQSNEVRWPTPLKSFLTQAWWLPVQRGGNEIRFVSVSNAWLSSEDFDPRPPRFVDLVSPSVVRGSEDGLAWLRASGGLGVLDNPSDAGRALRVFAQAAKDKLDQDTDVRRFSELFSTTWNTALQQETKINIDWIPIRIGDSIEALSVAQTDNAHNVAVAYFVDQDDNAKKQLLSELEEPLFDFDVKDVERSWIVLDKLSQGRFRRMSQVPLEVHVDGCRFESNTKTPFLRDVFGGWITDFLICAAEYKGGAFFHSTQKTLTKLKHAAENLRVVVAQKAQISMNGKISNLPIAVRGGVVLREGSTTVLILEAVAGTATLDILAGTATQLAMALNQKALATAFEAALLRLAKLQLDKTVGADDDDLAEALGIEVEHVQQTRRYTQLDFSSHIYFAQPLAAYLDLSPAVDMLVQLDAQEDLSEEVVLQALKPVSLALNMEERQLLAQLGTVSDITGLKQVFSLDLVRLNEALGGFDGRFKRINNEELHRMQFRAHLTRHNTRIVARMRPAFIDHFDQLGDLSRYVQLRSKAETIEPDADWFERYDELPEEIMEQRIEIWLLSQGVSTAGTTPELPDLTECREKNGRALRNFAQKYGSAVSAWVRSTQDAVTDLVRRLWFDPEKPKLELIQIGQGNGWLEFRLLDDDQIAAWLHQSGHWPAGKPVTTDLPAWGISEDTVTQAQTDTKRDREARRQERNEIVFAGQKASALVQDYQTLLEIVRDQLTNAANFLDIDASIRSLADLPVLLRGSSSSGSGYGFGSGSQKSTESMMSDEQKSAIGFIGEQWAFGWIKAFHKQRHNLEIDENCWVSSNRNVICGGSAGRDDHGYDFEVRLTSTTYYYEVKASTGNPQFFEMGPTEIATAQRYKADRDNKYRILYIAYANDPKRVAATLLPNPFSKEGNKKIRVIGKGSVKYEFSPTVK
ncbi:MAG: DUF3883 domain-containing protein [Acidobacteria bacterium]|nr:DUF3883 domain-containing protein [Acidobacteriota bacterium]